MECKILDSKREGAATCYLVKSSLAEYLKFLPEDFYSFDIQREETTNTYLDRLSQTIINRGHIPTIVLLADKKDVRLGNEELVVSRYRILDGLQRTLRMKAFGGAVKFIGDNYDELVGSRKSGVALVRAYAGLLKENDVQAGAFISVLDAAKKSGMSGLYAALDEGLWFEIWVGLTLEEQVRKMLVLNAGHKPVKTRHQLELIFLSILPRLEALQGSKFEVFREKHSSSTTFSKNRKPGQFHFASVIAALVAYFSGKPITTNAALVSDLQSEDDSVREEVAQLTFKLAERLVEFLLELDEIFSEYGDEGVQWFGREVTLVGMFAALGAYRREKRIGDAELFKGFAELASGVDFNLAEFERVRNSQNLSRVNVGSVNKRAVYQACMDILAGKSEGKISWQKYFGA